jgi:toxin FitB
MIVVDTNVAAELMRSSPTIAVWDWIHSHSRRDLYTTAITVAEIRYGIERLPDGRRKDLLRTAAHEAFSRFSRNVLPFDAVAAVHYSWVMTGRREAGRPIDTPDAQIAAICGAHGAVLATRNTKDFDGTDIDLIDPWQSS